MATKIVCMYVFFLKTLINYEYNCTVIITVLNVIIMNYYFKNKTLINVLKTHKKIHMVNHIRKLLMKYLNVLRFGKNQTVKLQLDCKVQQSDFNLMIK